MLVMSTDQKAKAARGISGEHTTAGVPHGSTSLTPFLALADPAGAIDFYAAVFGARVVDVTDIGGVVVHADLDMGTGHLELGAVNPEYRLVAMPSGDGDCYSLGLYCEDVDSVVEAAVERGAIVREPVAKFVSGDRYASIRDPFGVRWSVMSRVEDLSPEESARRVAEWAAGQP